MSVERSEFEFRVHTPLELAGAEEGAGELERAIGKARALGRNVARLERQLARVRRGMRHFRLAHPGVGEPRAEREEAEEREGEMRRMMEETEAWKRGFRPRPSQQSHDPGRDPAEEAAGSDEGDEARQKGVTTGPPPETGAISEAAQAGATEAQESPEANWPEADGAEPPAAEPVEAGIGEEGGLPPDSAPQSDEAMAEAGPATAAAAEPVTAVWNARAQQAVEEMVREAMSKHDTATSQREVSQEERLAAVEARLGRLEERGRMNRDGG
jgi:hypothetical protein